MKNPRLGKGEGDDSSLHAAVPTPQPSDLIDTLQRAADGDVETQKRVNAALRRLMWKPKRGRR